MQVQPRVVTDAPDPIDIAVGTRIRLQRRSLHISQGALGQTVGITFQQIQKYERGSNRVSASMLVHIANALDCTASHLIGEEEDFKTSSLITLLSPEALDLVKAFARVSGARDRQAILNLALTLGDPE